METFHCLKTVRIRRLSAPCFSAFGLNTPHLSVFSSNAGKCGPEVQSVNLHLFYDQIASHVIRREFY